MTVDIMIDSRLQHLLETPNLRSLAIVRDHISGMLYAVPNLRTLRKQFPNAHITLMANPYGMPILKGCPYVDEMVPFFQFRRKRSDRIKGLWTKFQAWMKLVGRVDLVVNIRWVGPETLAFTTTLGKPYQVAYSQDKWDHLIDLNIGSEDLINDTTIERNARVLEAMDIPVDSEELEMWLDPADVAWANNFLHEHGWREGEPLFAIHAGSHWGCNEWLPERWSALANGLLARYGGHILLTGTERERPLTTRIAQNIAGPVINAAGHTDIPRFATLLNAATMVIAVDTAPTQICQALNKTAVILMGSGNMTWLGKEFPANLTILQDNETADAHNPHCQFGAGTCHSQFCSSNLANIQLGHVMRAVSKQMAQAEGPRVALLPPLELA